MARVRAVVLGVDNRPEDAPANRSLLHAQHLRIDQLLARAGVVRPAEFPGFALGLERFDLTKVDGHVLDVGVTDTPPPPTLRVGFIVPFNELEPEPFATFVHGTLAPIAALEGWADLQKPEPGHDGGFDSWATNTATGKLVCIQCKRYKNPLSIPEVGHELAKVALRSSIQGSVVDTHLIITCGPVREILRIALRAQDRKDLRERALAEAHGDELRVLRTSAHAAGIDVDSRVTSYVDSVQLRVWSANEFDVQLGRVWDHIQGLLAKTFVVHPLVHEFPRPDFDEGLYRNICRDYVSDPWIDPRCSPTQMPNNISTASAANPWRTNKGIANSTPAIIHETSPVLETLIATPAGSVRILVGRGGAGKTTSLERVCAALMESRCTDPTQPLPILVRLGSAPASLDQAIHTALHLRQGHWVAIPGSFLLLLDGLDEVPMGHLATLSESLRQILRDERVACAATARDSGPPVPVILPVENAFLPLSLGPSQVAELAAQRLSSPEVAAFVDAWLDTVGDDTFLASPQAVAAALHAWHTQKKLPESHRDLLENVLVVMSRRQKERFGPLRDSLVEVPRDTVVVFARYLIEKTWVVTGDRLMNAETFRSNLPHILREAKESSVYGADALSTLDVEQLLKHHGFIVHAPEERVLLAHETICAYLASDRLAATWRTQLAWRTSTAHDRTWLAAVPLIPPTERMEFLLEMARIDLILATRLAREARCLAVFEPCLLREAAAAIREYRQSEVATALAFAWTPACVAILRDWAAGTGHRQTAASRALASGGDLETVTMALRQIDEWANGAVSMRGEVNVLWERSPLSVRLRAARDLCADPHRNAGRRAESFDTLRMWGSPEDAELVRQSLENEPHEAHSFSRGIFAMHVLAPEACRQLLAHELASADSPGSRMFLLRLANATGAHVEPRQLVDIVLGIDVEGSTRADAFELLSTLGIPEDCQDRVVRAIRSDNATLQEWGWKMGRQTRFPGVIEVASEFLSDLGCDELSLGRAASVLAAETPCLGCSSEAIRCFRERFPERLASRTAHWLWVLCEADGECRYSLEIASEVFRRLADQIDARNTFAEVELTVWGAVYSSLPDLLREIGLRRILSWDLAIVGGGAPSMIRTAVCLAPEDELLELLVSIEPPEWRCRLLRNVFEAREEMRSHVADQIVVLLPRFVARLAPQDLLDLAATCWNDAIAQAAVDACIQFERVQPEGACRRAQRYFATLGHLFTVEQSSRFIDPAVDGAMTEELRRQLQFVRDQSRRRR